MSIEPLRWLPQPVSSSWIAAATALITVGRSASPTAPSSTSATMDGSPSPAKAGSQSQAYSACRPSLLGVERCVRRLVAVGEGAQKRYDIIDLGGGEGR